MPTTPKVVCGLKGSSADMFLDNAEYRKFLFREFGVSTVDEESAAVVMVSFVFYLSWFPLKYLPIFTHHFSCNHEG